MLTVDGVDAYYNKSKVLNEISFSVNEGEVLAVLGRNGAGKTTLLRSIMGMDIVTTESGSIIYDNEDVTSLSAHERSKRGISIVPQNRRIIPNLTVEENLLVARSGSESESTNIEDIYDLFPRIKERATQPGHSLSGGEKQMLAIGRAITQYTDLLLLDETFEGLAPQIVETIYERLKDISNRDISVVIVGQQINKTLQLSDRAIILQEGDLVHESTAKEIIDDEGMIERYLALGSIN